MRGGHTSVGLCNTTILWAALASHCLPGEIQGVIIYKALHGTGLFVGPPVPKGISLCPTCLNGHALDLFLKQSHLMVPKRDEFSAVLSANHSKSPQG